MRVFWCFRLVFGFSFLVYVAESECVLAPVQLRLSTMQKTAVLCKKRVEIDGFVKEALTESRRFSGAEAAPLRFFVILLILK
jgi:hypothetical protein